MSEQCLSGNFQGHAMEERKHYAMQINYISQVLGREKKTRVCYAQKFGNKNYFVLGNKEISKACQ